MIVAGASAYPRFFDFKALADIAGAVDAMLMVDMAHIAGLVAAGVHPSPVPYSDVVTSTTHKTLRGPRGGLILARESCGKKINSQVFPGIQGGPLMHVIAAKAVAFKEALGEPFRQYQKNVVTNAATLADTLKNEGLDLVSGGTDNHLMLVNLGRMGITGKDAEAALGRAGITVNKNSIPFETRGPHVTSGIRIGTPYVTSRGMMAEQMQQIGALMADVLRHPERETLLKKTKEQVQALCDAFPLYRHSSHDGTIREPFHGHKPLRQTIGLSLLGRLFHGRRPALGPAQQGPQHPSRRLHRQSAEAHRRCRIQRFSDRLLR